MKDSGVDEPVLAWLLVGVSKIRRVLFFNLINSFKLLQLFLDFNFSCFFFNSYQLLINVFYTYNAGICKNMSRCTNKVDLRFKYFV